MTTQYHPPGPNSTWITQTCEACSAGGIVAGQSVCSQLTRAVLLPNRSSGLPHPLGPQAGRKTMVLHNSRAVNDDTFIKPYTVARDDFSLNCAVACEAGERTKLERVCRYMARPPVAEDRLSIDGDGLVVYQLKRPFSDGTPHGLFEPNDFIGRLGPHSCPVPDTMDCSLPTPDTVISSCQRTPQPLAPSKCQYLRTDQPTDDLDG